MQTKVLVSNTGQLVPWLHEMIARNGRGRWRLLLQTFKMEYARLLQKS